MPRALQRAQSDRVKPLARCLDSLGRLWGRRHLAWGGGVFIAVVVVLAAFDVARSYRATLDDIARELDSHARILAEHTSRGLQAVDVVLRHVAAEHTRGRLARLGARELSDYLAEQAVGLEQIRGLALVDARGDVLAMSWLPTPPASNVGQIDGFRRLRNDPRASPVVGAAMRSSSDGMWMIPMGRRLEQRDGGFAGVVGARLRIEYFTDFYRDIGLEPGTGVTLRHRDAGSPLARYGTVDVADRFQAVRSLPDYPIDVVVARDARVALASWRQQAIGTVLRTLALAALAAALLALLARQFKRVDAARAKLEATRERFSLAVAGSDDGIWDWDHVKRTVFASARARDLMGLPPGPEVQPMEQWFGALRLHPADAQRRLDALNAHLEGRAPAYEGDYRVLHPDGDYRWVRVRGLCVRSADGRPLRLAGSIADIDALKRAEASLRESQERYQLAVAGSDVGVWDWDFVNGRAFESARARELQGLPPGPELQPLAELLASLRVHPDDLPRRAEGIRAHLAGETPAYECEYRVRHDDEVYRWVRVRALCIRGADGVPVRMAGSVSDIDARKRTEEALRLSEERYQLAVLGSTEGLWDWDMPRDLLFLSARCQELIWPAAGEPLRGRRDWIGMTEYHPDDVALVRAAISAHLHGRTRHMKVEYRLRHHSGGWRWYRQRGVAIRDAQGRPYRMAGSMEDITDRKQAEAERERLERQLRQSQRLEAMGTLAGGIAHDFNNILAAIIGYGEMVQKKAADGSDVKRHIDAAMSAAMRARSLVERILAFSRSGMGERVPVHVQSVVGETLELLRASLPAGIRLEHQLTAGHAAVLGDATQIHQVVMNLCANGVQAIGDDGALAVSVAQVELDEPRDVTTGRLERGRHVRLVVRDSGAGIAPDVLERIFDPFFTTKQVGVGTGLGLSLVHGIVTDLGGGIDVESTLGTGTTMTVWLPCSGEAQPPAPAPAADVVEGRGETILLVDDEATLVRLGEEMMAELGYEPVGFTSSKAALASLMNEPQRFDIVVTDEAMPEMTGSELVREIRKIRPDIPVVMMSGYVTPTLAARARDAGVVEVLSKPLVAHEIARSVAAALR